jgi:hypothetical protein
MFPHAEEWHNQCSASLASDGGCRTRGGLRFGRNICGSHPAWLRTKVLHPCETPPRGRAPGGIYRRTVRGDTQRPSLSPSSAAIRSSPHIPFARAMVAIKRWTSSGSGGRPGALDLHRQKRRNPLRCHRISVSGFTIVSTALQSISWESITSVILMESSARRGLTRRSW